ncbi:hypothetical protein HDU99_005535, partial [Rhizoclosmatium hyalinum]
WVEAVPIPDLKAETVIKALVTEVFVRTGIPVFLHTDGGAPFSDNLIKLLSKALGFEKTFTAPYWPRANDELDLLEIAEVNKETVCNVDTELEDPSFIPSHIARFSNMKQFKDKLCLKIHGYKKDVPFWQVLKDAYETFALDVLVLVFEPRGKGNTKEHIPGYFFLKDGTSVDLKGSYRIRPGHTPYLIKLDRFPAPRVVSIYSRPGIVHPGPPPESLGDISEMAIGPYLSLKMGLLTCSYRSFGTEGARPTDWNSVIFDPRFEKIIMLEDKPVWQGSGDFKFLRAPCLGIDFAYQDLTYKTVLSPQVDDQNFDLETFLVQDNEEYAEETSEEIRKLVLQRLRTGLKAAYDVVKDKEIEHG